MEKDYAIDAKEIDVPQWSLEEYPPPGENLEIARRIGNRREP